MQGEDDRGKTTWATALVLAALVFGALVAPVHAGPRLTIGFVSIPAGTSAASCSSAAKSALDAFFGNARVENGNGHAFDARFTVVLYCDLDVRQAYVLLAANETDSNTRAVDDLKKQIKARFVQLMPGARPL